VVARVALALVAVALTTSGCHSSHRAAKRRAAETALASQVLAAVPRWVKSERLSGNREAVVGARAFALAGIRFQIAHLRCPSCVKKGSSMRPYAAYPKGNLRKLAAFMEASKGSQ
jgi:hypothetical protein